ncbi:hypothetical protein ACFSO9_02790 [Mesonia maritima]|uniref:hypothetical protein n=1 Tax=Mesonia maritima TaxID=1793873 RepID=UPI0036296217
MRKSYLLPLTFLFAFLGIINLSTANNLSVVLQDSTDSKNNTSLPSKEPVLQDGDYKANAIEEYKEAYYVLDRLNKSIGLPPNKFNLQSPQATLEHFILNARNNDFESAAYALNLNLLPDNITNEEAALLAEKLYFVINQRVRINWDDLSDRPDGQIDISTTTNKAVAGKPRRSVVFFGSVDLKGRDIIFRLQRIKYKDYGAFWLISSNTVEKYRSAIRCLRTKRIR